MAKSLHLTFSNSGYRRFSSIFSPYPRSMPDGTKLYVYELFCHEIAFASSVRQLGTDRVLLIEKLRQHSRAEQIAAAEKLAREDQEFFKSWQNVSAQIDFGNPGAIEFEYDPDGKSISIEGLSLDLADYESRVATTSEMLMFVAAARRSRVAYLGKMEFWVKSWPLTKLGTHLLDQRSVDLDGIRVNANDYEQWDYLNPELEAELADTR
jgi:hypothetical protein